MFIARGDAAGSVLSIQASSRLSSPTRKKKATKNVVDELQIKSEEIETIEVEKMGRGTDDEEEALSQLQRLLDDNFYLLDTKQLNIASLEKALAIEPEVLDYDDEDEED